MFEIALQITHHLILFLGGFFVFESTTEMKLNIQVLDVALQFGSWVVSIHLGLIFFGVLFGAL